MWRVLTACLLVLSFVGAHHDGTDHHEEDEKALILLEIEPNVTNSTSSKDKRSPQGSSQALFGASPGQFVVRAGGSDEPQPDVPPEYLNLLQQLVAQQQQEAGATGHQSAQPVIQQLLVARNPDPSAVQFTGSSQQPPRRPPQTPQSQLQQLYFNRQFQQQIPVRPRILRPIRLPAPDYSALTASPQAHSVHEARLRASLAGNDPNLAAQTLQTQRSSYPTSPSPSSPGSLYDQHLAQLATVAQDQLTQLQDLPQQQQQQTEQSQSSPQQQATYTYNPQVRYLQQQEQRPVSYSTSSRQSSSSPQQLIQYERVKPSRRPSAPEQYLRETSQPDSEQLLQDSPQQQTSNPSVYLSSQSGQQIQSESQADEIISQLLSQQGRGLYPGASSSAASSAEELIRSTTPLPPSASRSSIFVTQTANVKGSRNPGKITIEEVDSAQQDAETPVPVIHLPTPKGQRPLTQSEFQALVDAGFNISPAPEDGRIAQTAAPEYYTTKKQRSYVTPAPPTRNRVSYRTRQKPAEEEKEVRTVPESYEQREQVIRYQLQGTKPQQEQVVQYVTQPESQSVRQGTPVTKLHYVTQKQPEPQEETIHFISIPSLSEDQDVRQKSHLTRYPGEEERASQQAALQRYEEERERRPATRYEPEDSQSQIPRYQSATLRLPQTEEEAAAPTVPRFHPIIVAELPTTTPEPTTPRRRRPRPSHSRVVYRAHPTNDQSGTQEQPTQYLVSYDSIPEATSFGTKNRVRGRRPTTSEDS